MFLVPGYRGKKQTTKRIMSQRNILARLERTARHYTWLDFEDVQRSVGRAQARERAARDLREAALHREAVALKVAA